MEAAPGRVGWVASSLVTQHEPRGCPRVPRLENTGLGVGTVCVVGEGGGGQRTGLGFGVGVPTGRITAQRTAGWTVGSGPHGRLADGPRAGAGRGPSGQLSAGSSPWATLQHPLQPNLGEHLSPALGGPTLPEPGPSLQPTPQPPHPGHYVLRGSTAVSSRGCSLGCLPPDWSASSPAKGARGEGKCPPVPAMGSSCQAADASSGSDPLARSGLSFLCH